MNAILSEKATYRFVRCLTFMLTTCCGNLLASVDQEDWGAIGVILSSIASTTDD
ncbi:hypothetical protein KIN20_018690 [Parelaphostrongylus tenuis]|uniref:Uncharacterized protein n=1 Tax=Parelaphostrongylus tenuis TaxID=148309 RepID=A0AAD5N1D8_PARTN|nr:hypothetical protein KIN20_018690 [Parelaphostrongylus tenuis]